MQSSAPAPASHPHRIGEERYLVSMFVDMRGSTRLAELRLPFDTVFIVNRFLAAVSRAVIECGGQPNQFVGDGQLALFGLAAGPQGACRQALRAAAMIAVNVDELNRLLGHDLNEPIRFGIGIHGGEVIIGDIGYREHMVFTALGDAVNVAARLQDMTKNLGCEAIVSEQVRIEAGLPADALPAQEIAIRGRTGPMVVRVVASAKALSALVDAVDLVAASNRRQQRLAARQPLRAVLRSPHQTQPQNRRSAARPESFASHRAPRGPAAATAEPAERARRRASSDHLPVPRTARRNNPPAIARSFSKCSNSFRTARFVVELDRRDQTEQAQGRRAEPRMPTDRHRDAGNELQRDGGDQRQRRDAEFGHADAEAAPKFTTRNAPSWTKIHASSSRLASRIGVLVDHGWCRRRLHLIRSGWLQ